MTRLSMTARSLLRALLVFCILWMQAPSLAQAQPIVAKVVIFKDAGVPVADVPSSPQSLGELFAKAGYAVTFATAKQLAAPETLTPARCDLLILPYGPSFPGSAVPALRRFLRAGGSFISMGGYAFDNIYGEAKDSTPALRNGGFEQPGAWLHSARDAVFERTSARAHSGKFSFRIHTPTSLPSRRWRHVYQRVNLNPKGLYALSAFLKTDIYKAFLRSAGAPRNALVPDNPNVYLFRLPTTKTYTSCSTATRRADARGAPSARPFPSP